METILAGGLNNDYLIPLDSMMPSLAKLETTEDVQLAYAEVSTMIEYLAELRGDEVIAALLDDLAGGEPFDSAFTRRLDMDLDAFQKNGSNLQSKKFKNRSRT